MDEVTKKLTMIWESADKKIEEELDKSQNDIVKLMEKLMEEKMQKIIEINKKYELELIDLEAGVRETGKW